MLYRCEFVLFEQIFVNDSIRIYIVKSIYQKHQLILNNIFRGFQCTPVGCQRLEKGLYICNANVEVPFGSEMYEYDTTSNEWIFKLLTDVELYVIKKFGITVFHGASLCKDRQTVLIMGPRKSGKSTLTHFLIKKGWKLIDDDCIYFNGDTILGLGFPLKLRKIVFECNSVFASCVDMEGEARHLITTTDYSQISKLDKIAIIFPKYIDDCIIEINKISKIKLFTKLLQNVRFSYNEQNSLKDVTRLMRCVGSGYIIFYSNCTDVECYLEELLKDEK